MANKKEQEAKKESPASTMEKEEATAPKDKAGLKRIKVDAEQLAKLQKDKKLVGYDPITCEALIK